MSGFSIPKPEGKLTAIKLVKYLEEVGKNWTEEDQRYFGPFNDLEIGVMHKSGIGTSIVSGGEGGYGITIMPDTKMPTQESEFEQYTIKFEDREEFEKVLELNHLATDIGYCNMMLFYSNQDERDLIVEELVRDNYRISWSYLWQKN